MKTEREILIAARARIADPGRWCQFAIARNAYGDYTAEDSPQAVQWCALGAVCLEADGGLASYVAARLDRAAQRLFGTDIVPVNNGRGHGPTIQCFDAAIEECSSGT